MRENPGSSRGGTRLHTDVTWNLRDPTPRADWPREHGTARVVRDSGGSTGSKRRNSVTAWQRESHRYNWAIIGISGGAFIFALLLIEYHSFGHFVVDLVAGMLP